MPEFSYSEAIQLTVAMSINPPDQSKWKLTNCLYKFFQIL